MTAAPAEARDRPLLQVRGIGKRFAGVVALADVDFELRAGEVTAVIGENGAGKSTLMKILAGVLRPDAGEIVWDGQPVAIETVRRAAELGIALIHQELNLCDNLSAGANVFLGREPHRLGFIRPHRIELDARRYLEQVGLDVAPDLPVSALGIGQRQLVEIAKALSQRARLVIMDEPTSSLSFDEASKLFEVIAELKRSGVAVAYISHRLAEVETIADRVVGLRDGRVSGELSGDEIEHIAMVRLMVGRDIEVRPRRRESAGGPVRLDVRGLRTAVWPAHAIDLRVRAGEIVGLAGLVGSGRSELLETLFGARAADDPGRVEVDGRPLPAGDILASVRQGLALVPEDRKQQGLLLEMSVQSNLTLASLRDHCTRKMRALGVLSPSRERDAARAAIDRLDVRVSDPERAVSELSGGNQQKVVLGKWLARTPAVLLLDEPTRGVDIAAKDEIYARMEELAAEGLAIVFASSEMAEILSIADRILVLHEGRIAGELPGEGSTEESVMRLATGAESKGGSA